MKRYTLVNNITGWVVFIIASTVYLLTMEPTASFWDCGEFISSAFKLEVGHPPGAPFFMLLGRFFSMFAGGDVTKVAVMVNASSALASGATILFLFWSITHIARKLLHKEVGAFSTGDLVAVMGAGAVGALAYTFCDSFWFSAVEGEVYALSSLFTALVFWAMLKWENVADESNSNRWLILIAYLMGLSIGVHLLNLLAIPALVLIYYFRKYTFSWKGLFIASLLAVVLLGFVMYGLIQGSIIIASWFELLFVNSFGLPYNSGLVFFILLFAALATWGLMVTKRKQSVIWNTVILGVTMILLGYGSYATTVIRSNANPPMDQNDPGNTFSLISYLNREQYGDRPLLTGQYYNAPVVDEKEGSPMYSAVNGRYEVTGNRPEYVYDDRFTTIFPRMYSPEQSHVEAYKSWANITSGTPITVENKQSGKTETLYKPSFADNLQFFFSYQVMHMYFRYFMWNFAGRQNDMQGNGEVTKGNWISGIKFLDEIRLGPQDNLPDFMTTNKAHNVYYMLPFLLGILGLYFHYGQNKYDFWIVMVFFFMTGLAIVLYLNQTPYQPRERDYAYAGSFYAYAIWIGLGVMALYEYTKKLPSLARAVLVTFLCLGLVPGIMAQQNWDDHDRSNRYTCRDFGANYLNSCAPNAIIFTNGDNDTFPLWYCQEVEGIRTDIRVTNLSYLGADWYIRQMQRQAYESQPLPFMLNESKYRQGNRDIIYLIDRINQFVDLRQAMQFLASDDPQTKSYGGYSGKLDYLPTKKFFMPIDSAQILKTGTVSRDKANQIVKQMQWVMNRNYITKSDMMVLDLIANSDWKRPIYFAVTVARENYQNLENYFSNEGLAYRLVPIRTELERGEVGSVNTDVMYDNVMNKFKWGGIEKSNVYLDENISRMTSTLRNHMANLAVALVKEGKKDSARKVLDKCIEILPNERVAYNYFSLPIAEQYYKINEGDKALSIVKTLATSTEKELKYYFNLPSKYSHSIDYDKQLSLHVMAELARISEQYAPADVAKGIKTTFETYYSRYVASMPQGAMQ